MNLLLGVALAVISASIYAFKDVFFKEAIKKTGVLNALFYGYLIVWLPAAVFFVVFEPRAFSQTELLEGLIVGSGLVVGNLLFFKAIEIGNVSLVGPISELWSVFTAIAAALFLGELLRSLQIAGVFVAFAGIFVVSKHSQLSKQLSSKSIHYALAAAVVWGCTWFLVKPLVDSAGIVGAFVLYEGVGTIALLAWGLAKNELKKPAKILLKPSLLQMAAYLFETWGILISTVSLVSVVFTPAYVLVLIPASAFFLKEKLEFRHYVGIGMLLLGLLLITTG